MSARLADRVRGAVTKPRIKGETEKGDETSLTYENHAVWVFTLCDNVGAQRRRNFLRSVKKFQCYATSLTPQSIDSKGRPTGEGAWRDKWEVHGDAPAMYEVFMENHATVVLIEQLIGVRVPVVASGAAPAQATQRQAYKDQMREMRQSATAKLLARDNRYTDDEGEGAWAQTTRDVVVTPPLANPLALSAVPTRESAVVRGKGEIVAPVRPGAKQRHNRRDTTQSAARGLTAKQWLEQQKQGGDVPGVECAARLNETGQHVTGPKAPGCDDQQFADTAVVYCDSCARPKTLCRCSKPTDGLTAQQIREGK